MDNFCVALTQLKMISILIALSSKLVLTVFRMRGKTHQGNLMFIATIKGKMFYSCWSRPYLLSQPGKVEKFRSLKHKQ